MFDGKLRVLTAFSREGTEKVYVQDRVGERGGDVLKAVGGGGDF